MISLFFSPSLLFNLFCLKKAKPENPTNEIPKIINTKERILIFDFSELSSGSSVELELSLSFCIPNTSSSEDLSNGTRVGELLGLNVGVFVITGVKVGTRVGELVGEEVGVLVDFEVGSGVGVGVSIGKEFAAPFVNDERIKKLPNIRSRI